MAELGDGKKKPSGAQNRKRKLEKEEKIKKLTSPIDFSFRPGTSSSTSARQLEETVNLEERTSTSISQVPAHTSTSTSPTPSEPIVNQPATEPDVRFCENVANDPALWPQVIPEETVNLEERTSTSISQVPAHTSTSTSPTPSEPIVNQPATEPDVRFCENVANDPALWPQVIPEETVNLEERTSTSISQVPAHTSTSTSPTPSEPIVNQPATEPDVRFCENVANDPALWPQVIPEETVNLEERTSTSISQVPAHTSTSTSPTPSEPIVNQPATEPDVRFCENVANDPALWPQVIPEETVNLEERTSTSISQVPAHTSTSTSPTPSEPIVNQPATEPDVRFCENVANDPALWPQVIPEETVNLEERTSTSISQVPAHTSTSTSPTPSEPIVNQPATEPDVRFCENVANDPALWPQVIPEETVNLEERTSTSISQVPAHTSTSTSLLQVNQLLTNQQQNQMYDFVKMSRMILLSDRK